MRNWIKVAIGLFIIFFLFANPYTRMIVLFLLPLGSGFDDLIEIVALVLLIILGIYKIIENWDYIVDWFKYDYKNKY